MKLLVQYIGNCVGSFDDRTGESLINSFRDVSDFACKNENATIITVENFELVSEIP